MTRTSMAPSATRAGTAPRSTGTAVDDDRAGVMSAKDGRTVPAALQGTHP
jgi:hypothetical protein